MFFLPNNRSTRSFHCINYYLSVYFSYDSINMFATICSTDDFVYFQRFNCFFHLFSLTTISISLLFALLCTFNARFSPRMKCVWSQTWNHNCRHKKMNESKSIFSFLPQFVQTKLNKVCKWFPDFCESERMREVKRQWNGVRSVKEKNYILYWQIP